MGPDRVFADHVAGPLCRTKRDSYGMGCKPTRVELGNFPDRDFRGASAGTAAGWALYDQVDRRSTSLESPEFRDCQPRSYSRPRW